MEPYKTIILGRKNENIENKYLNKIAIVVGTEKNKYVKQIKDNLNDKTILICVGNTINDFSGYCDFHIKTKSFVYKTYNPVVITMDDIKKLGFKIIVTETIAFDTTDLYNNYGITVANFKNISVDQYKCITNYINLLIIYPLPKRTAIGLLKYFFDLFDNETNRLMFLMVGLKIVTTETLKYYDKDYNIENFLASYATNNSILMSIHMFGYESIIKNLGGFHPCDYNKILQIKQNIIIQQKNIKFICWQESLQLFADFDENRKKNNLTVQDYDKSYNSDIINNVNYLMTPSYQYLKNLNMTQYYAKTIDLFYTINPDHYNSIIMEKYNKRKSQIILSGMITDGYASRKTFSNFKNKTVDFNNLITVLPHPVYDSIDPDLESKYYNTLAQYKGAFVGHHKYPLNFLLPKHVEVLMCGCLGFFEKNPLLQSQLGLIENTHYVACSDEKGTLIEDYNFYNDWLNNKKAKTIAENGRKYVINKFGHTYLINYMNFFKNC